MKFKIMVAALAATLGIATTAYAAPGDPGISDPAPGEFRLSAQDLEPGCFDLGRILSGATGLDASSFDADFLPNEELRLTNVTHLLPVSLDIDQVLVPSESGGYKVYNVFDTGTVEDDNDISAGQTATEMFAPDANGNGNSDLIEQDDVILCVSDDQSAGQNEPYAQHNGYGLVYAKNRPIIQPEVTHLGVSAIEPLNTYKIGFGYSVERWYVAPSFDGHALFPTVTDPNAVPSPTFGGDLPSWVKIAFRPEDFPYDARRVNDVDVPSEGFDGGDPDGGQNMFFSRFGDKTAWLSNGGTSLLTTVAQGDFPIKWYLRPSLAGPGSLRSVTFTDDQLRAWEKSWQAYYLGGPKPTMPLAPGTNSPAPKDPAAIINAPEKAVTINGVPAQVIMTPAEVKNLIKASKRKYRFTCRQKAQIKHANKRGKVRRKAVKKYVKKCKLTRAARR